MITFPHPHEQDAVLGGAHQLPMGSVVLGGLAGLRQRLSHPEAEQRQAALSEALRYGRGGQELLVQALSDSAQPVQRTAYLLLRQSRDPIIHKVLEEHCPYGLFQELRTIKAGGVPLGISGDATLIASLRQNCSLRIWDLESTNVVVDLPRPIGRTTTLALSLDGQWLARAVTGSGSTIEIWHVPSADLVHTLTGHEREITCLAIADDSKTLVSGGGDAAVRLWHLQNGKLLCTFSRQLFPGAHASAIANLALSRDGRLLVSRGEDQSVKLWNVATREGPRSLTAGMGARDLALSADGQTLAAIVYGNQLRLWHLPGGRTTLLQTRRALDWSHRLCFSPNGHVLATASYDGLIQLWQVSNGQSVATLRPKDPQSTPQFLQFSPDGQTLISGNADKTVHVWGIT